jgi:hypothetical protein
MGRFPIPSLATHALVYSRERGIDKDEWSLAPAGIPCPIPIPGVILPEGFGNEAIQEFNMAGGENKIRGIVHLIEPTKTFGQKGFRKRLVVLEQDNGRFVNYIPLDFVGDACDSADALRQGMEIEANYRLSGRKWQKDPASEVKYFLSAEATGFRTIGAPSDASPDANEFLDQAAYESSGDDVPF